MAANFRFLRLSTLLAVAALAGGCIAPITVREERPPVPAAETVDAGTLRGAAAVGCRGAGDRIALTLGALRSAAGEIERGNLRAVPEYNFLVARLIDHLEAAEINPWREPRVIDDGSDRFVLRGTGPSELAAGEGAFTPTDRLEFSGRHAPDNGIREGIGAPLVGFLDERAADSATTIPYRNVTAVVRFEGGTATLSLENPLVATTTDFAGRRFWLRADYGSTVAYALSRERIDKLGLVRLINPARYSETARLIAVQRYDPERVPVIVVHGLQDTPASFAPMYFELMRNRVIRENFQFWAFSYPSGYPYPMSAATFRDELDRFAAAFPDHRDAILIGHSMGGLISRLMVTDAGDEIWRSFFGSPPDESAINGLSRELLYDSLVFETQPKIGRAIFIASPHRGSELASNWIGKLAVRLVRFPNTLADLRNTVFNTLSLDGPGFELERFPSSIDTLSPKNRFVREINRHPIDPDIPFHSIIGDRGHGDSPDSSDGVVTYRSAHLEGAESEEIVPSNHLAHQHPEAIDEVRRILKRHLRRN
jgi:pimeloyl-ACP methyl ester carboxylesterase